MNMLHGLLENDINSLFILRDTFTTPKVQYNERKELSQYELL